MCKRCDEIKAAMEKGEPLPEGTKVHVVTINLDRVKWIAGMVFRTLVIFGGYFLMRHWFGPDGGTVWTVAVLTAWIADALLHIYLDRHERKEGTAQRETMHEARQEANDDKENQNRGK